MNLRRIGPVAVLLLIAVAIVGVNTFLGNREGFRGPGDGPLLAKVKPVVFQPEVVKIEAVGSARARQSVMLHPEETGIVKKVAFKPGQAVARGDLLVALDAETQRLDVERTKVQLANAQQLLDRFIKAKPGAIPESEIDSARTSLAAARVAHKQAEVSLERRMIRAPFDGVVGLTDVDVGDRVGPETEIAAFDDLSALLVDFTVPEQFLNRLKPGDGVHLSPWTAVAGDAVGEIVGIDSRINAQTRTIRVRAQVTDPNAALRTGTSFKVSMTLEGRKYPALAPTSILWGGDGSFAWVVRDGHATRVALLIVQRNPDYVLADAKLAEGDLIVYEGVQRMREGAPVDYGQANPPQGNGAGRPSGGPPGGRMRP